MQAACQQAKPMIFMDYWLDKYAAAHQKHAQQSTAVQ
jgi:hypothetical protein